MVSQRLNLPAKAPQFFKIIDSDIVQQTNLRIPKKFMRKYGKNLLDHVWLEVPSGEVWKVELVTSKGDLWLQRGWKEFAEHYSIGLWHFLVFRYEGNSRFHVIIFDMSASEIEYPVTESLDEDDVQSLEDFPTCQTAREKSYHRPCKKTRTNSTPPKHKLNVVPKMDECSREASDGVQNMSSLHPIEGFPADGSIEKARALQSAKDFKSRNPLFRVTMQPSYLSGTYKLNIRGIFADRYFTKKNNNANVILQVLDGRSWSVKCNIITNNAQFGVGWRTFAQDNYLEVGDICIFELINATKNLLNVVIFRGAKDANFTNGEVQVGKESIQIDEDKVERLEDFPTCQTKRDKSPVSYHLRAKRLEDFPTCQTRDKSPVSYHLRSSKRLEDFPICQTKRDKSPVSYPLRSGKKTRTNPTCRVFKMEESERDASDCNNACPMKNVKSEEDQYFLGYIGAEGKRTTTDTEKARALQSAKAFKSKNPFIMVTMRPSYVSHTYLLHVPWIFVDRYFTKKHNNVSVTLRVSDGSTWSVKCNISVGGTKFSTGWRTFVQDNHLAVGDVCIFELINGIENLLNVVIFRATKDANF